MDTKERVGGGGRDIFGRLTYLEFLGLSELHVD